MYVVAYIENMNGPEIISVETFDYPQDLLDFLINTLELYQPDTDYEPDENYEADLDTVIDYINSNLGYSDTDSVISITIMHDDAVLVQM